MPFNVTSEIVSVPNAVPVISVVEFPTVKPRNVLPEPTVIAFPVVMLTIVAFIVCGRKRITAG